MFPRVQLRQFYDPAAILSAIPVSIVVLVGSFLSFRSHAILRQDRDLVVHTYEVISTAENVLTAMGDAETGQRGFIITGDPAFLEPYDRASRRMVPTELKQLEVLVSDNSQQLEQISKLRRLSNRKFQELAETVRARGQIGFEGARLLVANRSGKTIMDDIRRVVSDIILNERRLLSRRSVEVHAAERKIVEVAICTAVLSTLMRFAVAIWRQRLLKLCA